MDNMKLYCMIYELNGMVKTMSEVAEDEERYYNSMIECLESKITEIIHLIEEKTA